MKQQRKRRSAGRTTPLPVQMRSTGEYRVVLPNGDELPKEARVIGRGPDLHVLTSADWYRLDLSDVPAEP